MLSSAPLQPFRHDIRTTHGLSPPSRNRRDSPHRRPTPRCPHRASHGRARVDLPSKHPCVPSLLPQAHPPPMRPPQSATNARALTLTPAYPPCVDSSSANFTDSAPRIRSERGLGHRGSDAVARKPHTTLSCAYKTERLTNTIAKTTQGDLQSDPRHRDALGTEVRRSRGRPREREQVLLADYRTVVPRRRMPAAAAPSNAMASAESAHTEAVGNMTPG